MKTIRTSCSHFDENTEICCRTEHNLSHTSTILTTTTMKQPTKLSRCTVNMLNDRAIILCSEMCNYNHAIEYYQLALILSADLKQCHHYGGTLSSCTKAKIDLCLSSSEDYGNDASRLSLYPCGKTESVEGFYTHTRPLPLLTSSRIYDQIHSLDHISCDEFEAILCFNMSICYIFLSDDKEDPCISIELKISLQSHPISTIQKITSRILLLIYQRFFRIEVFFSSEQVNTTKLCNAIWMQWITLYRCMGVTILLLLRLSTLLG